jgi:hypothetical protein
MPEERMATPEPTAEDLYQEARTLWADAIDIDLYDDPRTLRRTAAVVQRAVEADPEHVGALVLLSDLLAALAAYDQAAEFAKRLFELDPFSEDNKQRLLLLTRPDSPEKRRDVMALLAKKWHAGEW